MTDQTAPGGVTRRDHWDAAYRRAALNALSWHQPEPTVALELIDALALPRDCRVVDVGGGAATLVDHLLGQGFPDVSVLDVSETALALTRGRLGSHESLHLLHADILSWRPIRDYDLWHDRAVFHFLVDSGDRQRYLDTLTSAVSPRGHVIIATFAPDGPERCSGLPVARYSADELASLLESSFDIVAVRREEHRTPAGIRQPFTWVAAVRRGGDDGGAAIEVVLARARRAFDRRTPQQAAEAMRGGALLVDTRPADQRRRDGSIPGALVIDRNVLEWRLDPTSPDRIPEITSADQVVIAICNEGYSSSLAAAMLQQVGLRHASDVIGGFQAWSAAGLPVDRGAM